MPTTRVQLPRSPAVDATWAELRDELAVEEAFPPAALTEAAAAADAPELPDVDQTDVPFFTLDPPGSLDLDQAVHLERRAGNGFRVRYAIADVAAFVRPGGALDHEAHRRGETLYFPDIRVPLHPSVLNEDTASLLPGVVRPALVWTVDLDADAEPTSVDVRRARVRSAAKLDYPTVQAALDGGTANESLALLRDVGTRRQRRATERGAVDLPTPQQVVDDGPDGAPRLAFRAPLPAEGWNAQISLLTGMVAARLMLDGGVGLLRTLPPHDPAAVASLRRSAAALGIPWPAEVSYGAFVSGLDPAVPAAAALLTSAARVLRGAGYTAFDGAPPEQPIHSAVAAPYAHCTAPLRRLADRYVGEVCVALCAGRPVPAWARETLPVLPDEMAAADRRAHELDRAVVDLAEALVLAPCVGRTFDAVVVDDDDRAGVVQLRDPAVRARCRHRGGDALPLGGPLTVRLVEADPLRRGVVFEPA